MHPTKINRLEALSNMSEEDKMRYQSDLQVVSSFKRMYDPHPFSTHSSNQIHALLEHSAGCTCYYCDR